MNEYDEPDTRALLRRVDDAYRAVRAAMNKVARRTKPKALQDARQQLAQAEALYQQISNERDEFMEIRRGQRAQGTIGPITLTPKLFPGTPKRLA